MLEAMSVLLSVVIGLGAPQGGLSSDDGPTVQEALRRTTVVVYPADGRPVDRTVAEAFADALAPDADVRAVEEGSTLQNEGVFRVALADETLGQVPSDAPSDEEWVHFRLKSDGSGVLMTSREHLLYALFCQVRDQWEDQPQASFENGRLTRPRFQWVTGEDGFYGRRRRFTRGYDPEESIKELARLGASHVVVNALAQRYPKEEGPPGEVYYRFYQYAPDFDQYVSTKLNEGFYSPEYLKANLNFLQEQAQLAVKYGLTPGMHVANPRSVSEELLEEYPYLRGARVDHTFRSFKPRYTLTVAHPAVRWHYATMLKKLLRKVPELGFVTTLLNDSGSGFEYTSSLYPGPNGGPYVVREWQPDSVVARKAAENVIRYYRTLRDAAHKVNPDFRIIAGLRNIAEEARIIREGMSNGIDLRLQSQRSDVSEAEWRQTRAALNERGSYVFSKAVAEGNGYILGVPSPWRTSERLRAERTSGTRRVEIVVDPPSLAPYDINREVVRAYQLGLDRDVDAVVRQTAREWVGREHADTLVDIWERADEAVRATPTMPLYGSIGFTWYRLWDRPLVPDIGRIPKEKRAYYEDYLLSIFNNPQNVDLQADALWDLHSVEESERLVQQFDTEVFDRLDRAIERVGEATRATEGQPAHNVFVDLRDRLRAYRSYCMTLRNVAAWIAGVHGYLDAESDSVRKKRRAMVREMVDLELQNTKNLLTLWRQSEVDFMPIYETGENGHDYGPSFGKDLERKIRLMKKYGDAEPYIDPNYMWRTPDDFPVPEEKYIKY